MLGERWNNNVHLIQSDVAGRESAVDYRRILAVGGYGGFVYRGAGTVGGSAGGERRIRRSESCTEGHQLFSRLRGCVGANQAVVGVQDYGESGGGIVAEE